MLKSREQQVDASIRDAFHTAMPGETDAACDARGAWRQRLAAARGAGGGLLPALQALAQARDAAPGTSVQSLNFHDGALEMKLSAPDASSLRSPEPGAAQQRLAGRPRRRHQHRRSGYEGRIQVHGRRDLT